MTGTLISEAVAMGGEPRWTIEFTDTDGEVKISGEFQRGLARTLQSKLAGRPEIHQLELDSFGGAIHEGFALGRIIEERRLTTVVRNECSSACTLAFVASPQRWIEGVAKLGFHQYSFAVWLETPETIIDYFERKGVARDFIIRGFAVPKEEMWYPHVDELYSEGVITDKAHRHRDAR